MPSILVTCYSRTGKTKALADAIGCGIRKVEGVEVDVMSFNRVSATDFIRYEGIILGSPVYFGSVAAEVKELIDDTTFVRGKLAGKVGAAFVSSGDRTGGKETTLLSIVEAMLIHGMIVVGDPIDPEQEGVEHNGGHYGLAADGKLEDTDYHHAELFGKHVAKVVLKIFRKNEK
ncbi:MAG TPA: NAD(P)H-dependent oxidoreductase [Methanocorpusculum sp.]|nr:NAD(P)H-dependent oxidoreductase [Methanocorpusculum sp.]